MKHVFFVHSQITCLVAKEIIRTKKLSNKNCLIITLDMFENNIISRYFDNIKVRVFPKSKFEKKNNSILCKEYELYFWINLQTNFSNYLFYTIHDQVFLSKYIANNFRCKGYFYIEEGLGSFHKANYSTYLYNKKPIYEKITTLLQLPKINKLTKKINITNLLPKVYFYKSPTLFSHYDKLEGGYKISEEAFNFIDNTKLLNFECTDIETNQFLDAPFFVFDNLVASKICSLETLKHVFSDFINEHQITSLNIKFHPLQPLNEITVWNNYLESKNINFKVVDNNIVMEELFPVKAYSLFGFVSSLLYYNVTLSNSNGKSHSYLKKVFETEKREVPQYYFKTIQLLEKAGIPVE